LAIVRIDVDAAGVDIVVAETVIELREVQKRTQISAQQ